MSEIYISEINHVAYVKLNRPEIRNAFSPAMIQALTQCFQNLSKRKDLRAAVLQGEGKVFCAGADLQWMKSMIHYNLEQNREDALQLYGMFETMMNCPLPLVGQVHGAAIGGALGLMAVCDEVIAEENTQFSFSEVKLGIAPAVISSFVLHKGQAAVLRPLMISGQMFDGVTAQRAGLVHTLVPQGETHHEVQRVLHRYVECGPEAVRETKKLLNEIQRLSWEEKKERTTRLIAERRVSSEGQEGLQSFLDKRAPSWGN